MKMSQFGVGMVGCFGWFVAHLSYNKSKINWTLHPQAKTIIDETIRQCL